ncbi:MAG: 2-enoyl thioester reductase domain-containing protein [bacterium]
MKLPSIAKTIRFHQFGAPQEVLRIEEESVSPPQDKEVLLKLKFAPIHPSDINLIEGTYGLRPPLPAVPGNEGLGVVVAIGADVNRFQVGDWVKPPLGSWQQYARVPSDQCLKLPQDLDDQQAAMLCVNPPTAWRMLHDFVALQTGDWVIQNAANSAVGRCVIQIARTLGAHTVNLVRRPELAEELRSIGADVVLADDANVKKKLAEFSIPRGKLRLGLNAVGGESATRLADCLEESGMLVTYGAMSREALKIPNKFLIFKDLHFRGFWMSRWFQRADTPTKEAVFAELGALMREGKLHIPVRRVFPLEEIAAAVSCAQQSGEGKVLLRCN